MRNFGFLLLVAGILGFLYCSSQLQGLEAVPPDLPVADYFRYPAGRLELGRIAAAAAALIGLLMAFVGKGR